MIGTTVSNGWGTGVGTRGGGETRAGAAPTACGRGEGGEATTTVGTATERVDIGGGRVTTETVEVDGVTQG